MKGESSPSAFTPLQMWSPEESKDSHHGMEMAIVPSSTAISTTTAMSTISRFTVPDDWVVEDRRRTSGKSAGLFDRYYYDPETGLKFRSLVSVERYIAESKEKTPTLQMLGFDKKEKLLHKGKMAIVAQSATNRPSSLNLPDGWVVEECVRASGYSAGKVDRYYIEPGTGRKFRSLISVERHLADVDGSSPPTKESQPDNCIVLFRRSASSFPLPIDWTVKGVPRSSPNYADTIDKYYYEPGTGRRFRSKQAVERYLYEGRENTRTPKAVKSGNCVMPSKKSRIRMKKVSDLMEKTSSFDSTKPPIKIKWVLSGPGRDAWSPFVGESMVPDSVKQQWAKKFIFSVDYRNFNA